MLRTLWRALRRPAVPPLTGPASLPAGIRLYAVGDVHGHIAELDALLDKIRSDHQRRGPVSSALLVFLGDYIDRGPDSKAVISRLLDLSSPAGGGFTCHCLMGNHEASLLQFLDNPQQSELWFQYGALETLASYGVSPLTGHSRPERRTDMRDQLLAALPSSHLDFFRSLPPCLHLGEYLFVHAGIRPGLLPEEQAPDDMIWMREPFLSSTANHGVMVVHGHTITEKPDLQKNRIGIDTGVYESGCLTALGLEGTQQWLLQAGGPSA